MNEETMMPDAPRPQLPSRVWALGSAAVLLVLTVGSSLGGELGTFATAGFNAVPFALLAVLAYAGAERMNWARVLTVIWVLLMISMALVLSLGLGFIGALERAQPGALSAPSEATAAAAFGSVALQAALMLPAVLAAPLLLLRRVRVAVARILPIDPDRFTHTVALVTVTTMTWSLFVPYLVLGEPPLLLFVDQLAEDMEGANSLTSMVYTLLWTVPATILAVGYGQTRTWRESLERLGFVRPTLRQVGGGVLLALVLAAAALGSDVLFDWIEPLFAAIGLQRTDGEAFTMLLGTATPLSALVIGVTAGLGEELAVRGVLQPRIGILLSNLFFTALHAWQYGWDSLIIVFLLGLAMGLVRKRSNTTTAAIVHGVYNFTLMMLSWAGTTFGW